MLSWHCDTDLTPGSSTLSCRLLDEPQPSGHTVRWCLGCCGCKCSDSVLEITSMRPDKGWFILLLYVQLDGWVLITLSQPQWGDLLQEWCGYIKRGKITQYCTAISKSLHYEMKLKLSLSFKSMCILPGSDCGFLAEDLHVCGAMRRSFISWILPLIVSLVSL